MNFRTTILMRPLARSAAAAMLAAGLASAAHAAPAQTTPPGAYDQAPATYTFSGTELATTGAQTATAATFSANYTSAVFADISNPFGAGDLTFVYQFTNNGPNSIERLTANDFTGYMVDAGYATTAPSGSGFTSGSIAPNVVTRTSGGDTVGFGFLGSDNVKSGSTSNILVIKTNATQYTGAVASLQDGSTVDIKGFKPVSAAPEPGVWALMMGGVALMGFALRQRRGRASAAFAV